MGALRLVLLLASLQILLPRASLAVLPPPPPNITVMPEKMEYLIGDTVAIQCTAPRTREKIQGFQVSGTSGWAVDVRTTRRTYVHRFNITGPRDAGVHACTYVIVNQFRQPVRSQDSKSIFINVRDHPPRPTLELNSSSGVTVEGQPLVFRCAAPAQPTERRFHFYKEKVEVVTGVKLILGDAEGQLQVAKSVQNHTGNFSCGYEEKTEGRWIPSYPSRDVEVIVREPASAPRLAVEPPVGVVSEDYPLRLTCKASRAAFRLRYRFYRNGVEIPEGHADSQRRDDGPLSELYFQQSPRSFGGKFSCGVEEDVGGTWVPAPRSDAVDITVKDLPSQPALLSDPAPGHMNHGDPLLLTCSVTGPVARRKFTFYKDGARQFSETVTQGQALFSIPANALTAGNFSCRYEEEVGDKWILSPVSQDVTIHTLARSHFIPLVAGCAAGATTLILGLLLVVCLCRRRRGSARWQGLRNRDDPHAYPMAKVSGP